MKTLFLLLGFLSGLGLTFLDAYTTYLCLKVLVDKGQGSVVQLLPLILTGLVIAMNAQAGRLIVLFQREMDQQGEARFGLAMLVVAFCICLAFDGGSSWFGYLVLITNKPDITQALEAATAADFIVVSVISMLTTIGPFITTVFGQLLFSSGGPLANIFRSFSEK